MTAPTADISAVLTAEDSLVLASMDTPVEMELVMEWLRKQRARFPETKFDVLKLPPRNAPPTALTALVERLDSGEDRSIVPVRVFWLPPADRSRAEKLAGLLPGRDPYHPSGRQQRRILSSDPRRARVVAGESAKVSELRQQWRDTTVGEDNRDFAQFVTRRAILAVERAEYRILGPQYKSPRLVKPEILASTRFRAGLEKIPGATVEEAGKMLDELATGWSRVSVDLVSVLGRMLSRGFDPEIDYDEYQIAAMRAGLEAHPGGAAVLAPVLHRRRGGAGGDVGEPATAGARIRRYQPVFRVDGTIVAPLRDHLHPPQYRRKSALQVRAARIRRLHRREAVQPELVHRGHPLAHRKDVAAQAWSDVVRGRRLPRWPQRRHPAAAGVHQLRPVARDRRVRRIRPRR